MAAEYQVRMDGTVHGPFSAKQLKKLADSGRITEDAEVRQGDDGPWFPATKVKGLFDNAPSNESVVVEAEPESTSSSTSGSRPKRKKASSSRSESARKKTKSSTRKSTKTKRKRKVDASDVFDMDDDEDDDVEFLDDESDDEVEFLDDDDDLFEDDDGFEDDDDDFYDRPRRKSRSRGRSRSGTSWGIVGTGLLLLGIGVCIQTGSFGCQALVELISWPTAASALDGGMGAIGSRSAAKLLEMLVKGAVILGFVANILCVVGCSMAIFAPAAKGAKGLAIAAVSTYGIHTLTQFIYVTGPMLEITDRRGGSAAFGAMSAWRGETVTTFVLTWFPLFAGLILTSLLLWAIAHIQKDRRQSSDCVNNVWLIGIFVGIYIVSYLLTQIIEPSPPKSRTTAKLIVWSLILLRFAHLGLYGTYMGRLIAQTFYGKSRVS